MIVRIGAQAGRSPRTACGKWRGKWVGPRWLTQEMHKHDDFVIAKFDADKHKRFASEFKIEGYPSVQFFPKTHKLKPGHGAFAVETADYVKFLSEWVSRK
jgi:hypothetical protein